MNTPPQKRKWSWKKFFGKLILELLSSFWNFSVVAFMIMTVFLKRTIIYMRLLIIRNEMLYWGLFNNEIIPTDKKPDDGVFVCPTSSDEEASSFESCCLQVAYQIERESHFFSTSVLSKPYTVTWTAWKVWIKVLDFLDGAGIACYTKVRNSFIFSPF